MILKVPEQALFRRKTASLLPNARCPRYSCTVTGMANGSICQWTRQNAANALAVKGLAMTSKTSSRLIYLIFCALALAGCEEFSFPSLGPSADPEASNGDPVQTARAPGSVRVVEAPEVFNVTDTGLWDGRPSLGLVWVAYEGAEPTNVIIRNKENDKFVVGALYRRERFFPGPPFQLSSDAAAELGILAGRPTEIEVTALREESVPGAETEPEVEPEAETTVAAAVIEDPAPEVETGSDSLVAAAAAAIAEADPENPVTDAEPPRRPTTEGPNAPLPRVMEVTAAEITEEPVATDTEIQPADIAVSEPIADPIPTPSPGVSSLDRPFIQVGIFSVEENAQAAAQVLSDDGIIPLVEEQTIGERAFYRVVVGPARNASERTALLEKIKAQGFADAYFVRN